MTPCSGLRLPMPAGLSDSTRSVLAQSKGRWPTGLFAGTLQIRSPSSFSPDWPWRGPSKAMALVLHFLPMSSIGHESQR